MTKDAAELERELRSCPDFKTFYDENRQYMVTASLSELLDAKLKEKGLNKASVIRAAELSEVYAYQIFSGARVPQREKLICLAMAMGLDLDEVQTLLKCAGYPALYVKLPFDCVVLYGICRHLSVVEINELLYEYGLGTLG